MATKRQSYTTSEKLKIIKFAEEHGNRAAQREFGIAESNVRLWRKSKENLQKMPRLQRADRGRKAAWPRLEQDLMAWITEKRNNGLAILPAMVRLKALEMSKDAKYEITAGQFKASNHWCQRFMKRNGLSLRQKTTLAQRLPSDYEEKIVQFQRFIIKQRRAHSYPLHLMANMDESPIQFCQQNWHVVKHGLDWISKTWTGLVKHGLVKHGLVKHGFVKHGFVKHGLVKHGLVKHGLVKHGFVKGGFVKHGFVKGGFVKHGFVKGGFVKHGLTRCFSHG